MVKRALLGLYEPRQGKMFKIFAMGAGYEPVLVSGRAAFLEELQRNNYGVCVFDANLEIPGGVDISLARDVRDYVVSRGVSLRIHPITRHSDLYSQLLEEGFDAKLKGSFNIKDLFV